MAYTMEYVTNLKRVVPMGSHINEIKALFGQIEEIKKRIVLAEFDVKVPYAIKTRRLEELRLALFFAEHLALSKMREEIGSYSGDGEGNGHD